MCQLLVPCAPLSIWFYMTQQRNVCRVFMATSRYLGCTQRYPPNYLVASNPIYKPFRPLGRETYLHRGLTITMVIGHLRILGRSSKKVAISPFLMELQAFIGMPKEDCWVDAQLPNLQVNTVNQWNGSLKRNIHTAVGKRNSPDLKISATEIWFGTPNLSKVSISVRRHRSGQEWDRTQHLLVTSASRLQHNFPGRNAMPCQQ